MRLLVLLFCLPGAVGFSFGQRAADLKGSFGFTGFLDEGSQNHILAGGSGRIYLTRRFSIEPEFQYLHLNSRHYDIALVPNIIWDFGGRRIVPYVAGGVGLLYTSQDFGPTTFSNTDAFVTAGGGVKLYFADHWFIAPDIRVGFEPHLRISAGIGYTWRR